MLNLNIFLVKTVHEVLVQVVNVGVILSLRVVGVVELLSSGLDGRSSSSGGVLVASGHDNCNSVSVRYL